VPATRDRGPVTASMTAATTAVPVLVDTGVAVDHLRGFGPAVELLERLVVSGERLVASEISRFELLAGSTDEDVAPVESLLSVFEWVAVTEVVARRAAELARSHPAREVEIGAADYVIAATALILRARLLTTNVSSFPMITGLRPPY
jgi:predicted nucleic acid-binding protein